MNELTSPLMKRRSRRISLPPNVPRMRSPSQAVLSSNGDAPFRRCRTAPSGSSAPVVRLDKQVVWDQRKSAMLRSAQCGKSPKQAKRVKRRQRRQSAPQSEPTTTRDDVQGEDREVGRTPISRWESSPRKSQSCSPQLRRPNRAGVRTSQRSTLEAEIESLRIPCRTGSAGTQSPRKPTRRGSFTGKSASKVGRPHPFQASTMPSMQTEGGKQSCVQGLESLKKMQARGFGSLAA